METRVNHIKIQYFLLGMLCCSFVLFDFFTSLSPFLYTWLTIFGANGAGTRIHLINT